MMSRFWKTLAVLAATGILALVGFTIWSFVGPDPIVTHVSRTDVRLLPGTYRLVNGLEAEVHRNQAAASTYTRLGYAYLQAARENSEGPYVDQAERAFEQALARDETDDEAVSGMAMVYLVRHRFGEALRWGKRSLALDPHRAATYGILVDANIELGRYEDAVEAAQRMVDMRPDLASYSRVSYVRELYGDAEGAIDAMRHAVSAASGSLENTNWCRVYLGHLYFHQGNLDAAEKAYRQALHQLPGYGHALAGLGRLSLARGHYDEAVASYEAAVEAFPIPEYQIALGRAYEAANGSEKAEARFAGARAVLEQERASGMDVDDELALLLLERDLDAERALELAEGAYDRRPTIHNASILAWAYFLNGRPEQALRLAGASLRLGTRDAMLFYRAGTIAASAGDTQKAKSLLEQALLINPVFSVREAADARRQLATL